MVTFSLGTNSKRAAHGSTDRGIVMQMAQKRVTRCYGTGPGARAFSEREMVSRGIVGQ